MDISNRKVLISSLYKESSDLSRHLTRETAKELVNQNPIGGRLSLEERTEKLKGIRDAMNSSGNLSYTPEQQRLLKSYQDLFDNFETIGEYIYAPLQELGDWVADKTVVPMVQGVMNLTQGAKENGVEGATNPPDRKAAMEELQKASSQIPELQGLVKTYKALDSNQIDYNEFSKLASPKVVLSDLSSAFERELDSSINVINKKFASDYSEELSSHNLTVQDFNKYHHLAVAHHILTIEGCHKEARQIDEFVIKNAGFWSSVGSAASSVWEGTKSVVRTGVKYLGKAAKIIGKAAGHIGKWALKGIKFIASKLPFLGIIFSIPMAIKNCIEAFQNGKRIISDLDLPKYGFSRLKAITPLGVSHVRSKFLSGIKEHRDNPDNLKELLIIFRSIGAFWIDVLFAITNTFMAILDAIAIAGLFFPGVGWLVSAGAMGGSFLLALGIGGLEFGSEYFKDAYWEPDETTLLDEAKAAAQELLTRGTPAMPEEDLFEFNTTPKPASVPNKDVIETSEDDIPLAA